MKNIFSFFLIPIIVLTVNSCANNKEDTSSALIQMDQALNQPNRKDDEVNPDIPTVVISSCYRVNNSSLDNSTVDNSTITDNSTINNSTVKNCSLISFSSIASSKVDNSAVDNTTVTGNSTIKNSSLVCNSTIDNSTIDNSTVCYGTTEMSIVNRTIQNQIVTESVAPTVSSISPANGDLNVNANSNISVTFSETMNITSVTTNTASTSCSGTVKLSYNNFSSCIQMTSGDPTTSDNRTFIVNPASDLDSGTTYKIRVTTGVHDPSGNTMSSQFETGTGFDTK